MVEPDAVEALLGAPAGYPTWQVADMARRAGILPTWLSSLLVRGQPISPAAREYLDRTTRRVATLHQVAQDLTARHPVRVIKGRHIARRYPPGLLRESGDTDIVTPDEQTLWACIRQLTEQFAAHPQSIAFLDTPEFRHILVAMKWPAEEEFLDKPLGADISTCCFWGDLKTVPPRPVPVEDDDLCSLFAVAEERFQRRFRRRDMLDFAVLAEVLADRLGDGLTETVVTAARSLHLAPELRSLCRKTGEWLDLPPVWTVTVAELTPVATTERQRRKALKQQRRAADSLAPSVATGRFGTLRLGLPLEGRAREEPRTVFHQVEDMEFARTPVGVCLLVDDPNISGERYAAARAAARALPGD